MFFPATAGVGIGTWRKRALSFPLNFDNDAAGCGRGQPSLETIIHRSSAHNVTLEAPLMGVTCFLKHPVEKPATLKSSRRVGGDENELSKMELASVFLSACRLSPAASTALYEGINFGHNNPSQKRTISARGATSLPRRCQKLRKIAFFKQSVSRCLNVRQRSV